VVHMVGVKPWKCTRYDLPSRVNIAASNDTRLAEPLECAGFATAAAFLSVLSGDCGRCGGIVSSKCVRRQRRASHA